MGLIRLLILAVVIYLVWRLYRSVRPARRRADTTSPPRQRQTQRMVPCRYCDLYVPEAEAFTQGDLRFCSREHRRLFLQRPGS